MLAVPADRLPAALADLDPGNRALLDLSLRRGVSDAEIGELLRKTPEDVARGRDAVLELLADALDVPGQDRRERVRRAVAALPDDAWRPSAPAPEPAAGPEPEPAREPAEVPERDSEPRGRAERDLPPRSDDDLHFEPEPHRSRRGGLIAALGLLLVAGALAAILLAGGDDDEPEPDRADRSGSQTTPPPGDEPARGGGVVLEPLTDARARGRIARRDGGLLVISIGGLPRGGGGSYEAWLYDSVAEARSLGRFEGGARKLEGTLPPDAAEYRFLDISLEPADGNPNHSGDSVLRTPVAPLLEG